MPGARRTATPGKLPRGQRGAGDPLCGSWGITQLQVFKSRHVPSQRDASTLQHQSRGRGVQTPLVFLPQTPSEPVCKGLLGRGTSEEQALWGRRAGGFPANCWEVTLRRWNSACTRFNQFRLQHTVSLLTAPPAADTCPSCTAPQPTLLRWGTPPVAETDLVAILGPTLWPSQGHQLGKSRHGWRIHPLGTHRCCLPAGPIAWGQQEGAAPSQGAPPGKTPLDQWHSGQQGNPPAPLPSSETK